MKCITEKLSIKASLTGVLVIFTLLIAMVAFLGYKSSALGKDSIAELNNFNQQLNELNRAQLNVAESQLSFLNYLDAAHEDDRVLATHHLQAGERFLTLARAQFSDFVAIQKSVQGQPYADAIEAVFYRLMVRGLEPQLAALQQGDEDAYRAAKREGDTINQEFIEANQTFVAYANDRGAGLMESFDATMARYATIDVIVLFLVVFCVIAVRVGIVRIIARPLEEAVEHFDLMAKGDLSRPIADRGSNEIGKLFASMQHMQNELYKTVSTVRDSSGSIHVGAREIASGNADLSSRTEEQAASLQETAASMEQLTTTVRQNAENARQGSTLAKDASATADRGGEVVKEVVDTMHGISESSRQVADIIAVIDSIAFQTNILALNASVEAARAGEQGRGFAVVASEVRNLASRSAEAAGEIKRLIEASGEQVAKGASLVESAGTTMQDILSSVRRVSDIMDEISAASQEQSSGIEQVNMAVSQMDEVTQQNAALVEQASAAAASLEAQAEQLESAVSLFRLADSESAVAMAATALPVLPSASSVSPEIAKMTKRLSRQAKKAEPEWETF